MNFFRIAYKGKSKILKKLCELSNALVDVVSSFDADGDGVVDNAAKVKTTHGQRSQRAGNIDADGGRVHHPRSLLHGQTWQDQCNG